jgi:organic hydroperoxide reductase OsmC/OhrA
MGGGGVARVYAITTPALIIDAPEYCRVANSTENTVSVVLAAQL